MVTNYLEFFDGRNTFPFFFCLPSLLFARPFIHFQVAEISRWWQDRGGIHLQCVADDRETCFILARVAECGSPSYSPSSVLLTPLNSPSFHPSITFLLLPSFLPSLPLFKLSSPTFWRGACHYNSTRQLKGQQRGNWDGSVCVCVCVRFHFHGRHNCHFLFHYLLMRCDSCLLESWTVYRILPSLTHTSQWPSHLHHHHHTHALFHPNNDWGLTRARWADVNAVQERASNKPCEGTWSCDKQSCKNTAAKIETRKKCLIFCCSYG